MSTLLRHPATKAIAGTALIACACACAVLGAIFLGAGSLAVYLGLIFEVLPRETGSAGNDGIVGSQTGLGLGVIVLGLLHLGLVVPLIVSVPLLWRDRTRTFVLTSCGLTALLGICTVKLTTLNTWSNLTVLGGLVAACVAWGMTPSSKPGTKISEEPQTTVS